MSASTFAGKEYTLYRAVDGKLVATTAKIPKLGPHDALVRITHSGVCHTDEVFFNGGANMALGHEGVGVVEEIGSSVNNLSVGERVGGGFLKNSCGHCKYCTSGREISCYNRVIFGEGDLDNGTFSQYFVANDSFLYKIPEGLSSEHAAPLQCAGATVYSALKATVTPDKRVGIYGIGGLGHLAIQFASELGAETIVYSTTADKEAEARGFGASEFHLIKDMYDTATAPIDVLVITGTHYPDWDKAMVKEFLARDGVIVPLSAPSQGPITLPAGPVLFQGFHLHSSLVASPGTHNEMLQFAARKGIKPLVQVVKHKGVETIQQIFNDLDHNKVRYRAVLEL